MRRRWRLEDLLGFVETWSALRALERSQGRGAIEAFRRDVTRAWEAGPAERLVRWPLTIRAGRL